MYNRVLGGLLLLYGIGGILSLVHTVSNPGYTVGKKAFIGLVQLVIVIVPVYFSIKGFKKKLCSEKTALTCGIILLVFNSVSFIFLKDHFVRYLHSYRLSRQASQFQMSEIMQATAGRDIEKMKKLIAAGVDVNERNRAGYPALVFANTFESLQLLVENGADVNFIAGNNNTILNMKPAVTYYSSYKATKFLLEHGLDEKIIKLPSSSGSTALHYADQCSFCDDDPYQDGVKNVELLIKHGAPLNVKDIDGNTPIFTVDDESKKVLIECGADIHVRNKKNENLLFKVKDPELFKSLVIAGLDKTVINSDGETLLHHAANEEIIDYLVGDININHKNKDGRTALFWCFYKPNKLKALLKHKADVNIADNKGDTALHRYVEGCYNEKHVKLEKVVQLLLETNININHKNNKAKTALDYARYDKMRNLLISKGAKPSS